MKKNILFTTVLALVAFGTFTSCEEEEKVAQTMNGVWETTDVMFTRTYNGQTLRPTKTVLRFDRRRALPLSATAWLWSISTIRTFPLSTTTSSGKYGTARTEASA
ncbi:MAG: hypothetical protein K6G08_06450 [Prevotella sp.]|nr:hypothetical protein [Prevotella sp.]